MTHKRSNRAAQGAGTIRKKTVHRKGGIYNYWEARITVGHDPGTGRQIQPPKPGILPRVGTAQFPVLAETPPAFG